jgi:hypothetical protein
MAKAVFVIAKSESQAIAIADQFRAAAFPENDISVLLPDKQGTKDFAHEQHTRNSRRRDGRRNCRRGSGRCVGMDGYRSARHPRPQSLILAYLRRLASAGFEARPPWSAGTPLGGLRSRSNRKTRARRGFLVNLTGRRMRSPVARALSCVPNPQDCF